jgi:integrase
VVWRRSDGRLGAQLSRGARGAREFWREYLPLGTGSNREAAETLLTRMQDARDAGLWKTFDAPPDTNLVGPFLHDWNEHHRVRTVDPDRVRKTTRAIENHIAETLVTLDDGSRVAFGSLPVSQVGAHHVLELMEALRSKTTKVEGQQIGIGSARIHVYDTLRMAWDYAVISRRAANNVVNPVSRPSVKHAKPKLWTDDQLLEFLRAPLVAEDRYHAGYWLGAYPGLRESEILGLQWKHIDLAGSAVQVVQQLARSDGEYILKPKLKADAEGEWRVTWPEAVEALRVHRARRMAEVAAAGIEWSEDQMVFLTEKGMPVNTASWWTHFHVLARKLGLPLVKFHSFRHKAATTDNRAAVDPNTRMLQRGRGSMESERAVYIHPDLLDQHVAAEASHRVFFERRNGTEA